jgi:predicted esterase
MASDIHQGQPVLASGAPLENARAVMVMIHGRGADARSILSLSSDLAHPNAAYLAPQAKDGTWYPFRFIEPVEKNEPYLTSALNLIDSVIKHVNDAGISTQRIVLLGFSQGACLALEYAARNPKRYGGVIAYTGGLIGSPSEPRAYTGSFEGTPIFIGSSDVDFHVPLERVKYSTDTLKSLDANVTERIYPGMGHTINDDEISFAQTLLEQVVSE